METELDVQRDHGVLIRSTMRTHAPGGLLIFSNNFRKFRLDREALGDLEILDITAATIPKDFARDPKVHHCFEIRRRPDQLSSGRKRLQKNKEAS
jgi:23S rRNA (guanine2445-N2)-methyltransferase / 23S rRNA (guanine2069-N7)-methyltransferase